MRLCSDSGCQMPVDADVMGAFIISATHKCRMQTRCCVTHGYEIRTARLLPSSSLPLPCASCFAAS